MNKCRSCNITIENNLNTCPLCGKKADKISDEYYNGYPEIKKTYLYDLISQLMLFLMITGSVTCLVLDFMIKTKYMWSLIAIAGQVYLYFSTKHILKKNNNISVLIMVQLVLVTIVVTIIDFSLGFDGWSVNFVIPFSIVGSSIILNVLSIFMPKKYKEYIFYIFIIAIIGIVPLVALLTDFVTVKWPSLVCVLYSLFTIVFMLLFSRRRFKTELIKRLHI